MGLEWTNLDLIEQPKNNKNELTGEDFESNSDFLNTIRESENADTEWTPEDLLTALDEPNSIEEALDLMYERYMAEDDQEKILHFLYGETPGYTWQIGIDSTDTSYLYFSDLSLAQQRHLGNKYGAKELFLQYKSFLEDEDGLQYVKSFIDWNIATTRFSWFSDDLTFNDLTAQDQQELQKWYREAYERFND